MLNPTVFVTDEKDPVFRAHILKRLEAANDPKRLIPADELKKRLAKRRKQLTNA